MATYGVSYCNSCDDGSSGNFNGNIVLIMMIVVLVAPVSARMIVVWIEVMVW